jgi:hypothetical protein
MGQYSDHLASAGLWNMNATYSCIEGGYAGEGNIDMDPLFVDAVGGDLRLRAGSPCIDAGSNAAVPAGVLTDLLGLPRFFDDSNTLDCQWVPGTCGTAPIVDMGAHEFVIIPGDFDDDYDVDGDDLDLFVSCASGPGLPYEEGCEAADLDADQDVDSTDFAILQRCHSGAGRVARPACAD